MLASKDKKAVKVAVDSLLRMAGVGGPPIDLAQLARVQGVLHIDETHLGGLEGCLIRRAGGFHIGINRDAPETRRRESLAHEIAHTLFTGAPPRWQYRYLTTKAHVSTGRSRRREERLCDLAATEILMPERFFRPWLARTEASIRGIEATAAHFQVSPESAAMRFGQLVAEPVEVVCWKPRNGVLAPAWFSGFQHFRRWARQKDLSRRPMDIDSAPVRALWSAHLQLTNDEAVVADRQGPSFYCESKAFGPAGHRYVLSVVKPPLSQYGFHGRLLRLRQEATGRLLDPRRDGIP